MDTGFIDTAIPDLSGVSLDELTQELTAHGCGVLARALTEYRRRLEHDGVPVSSFNAGLSGYARIKNAETVTLASALL